MDVAVAVCNTYHPDEVHQALLRLLEQLEVALPSGARVLVKPNAVTSNRPEQATATHPAVVDAVCRVLADAGNTMDIGDSSSYWMPGYTRRSFDSLGLTEVARRHGAGLVCFEEERFRVVERDDPLAPRLYLAELHRWDLVVNVPKLKVHRISRLSGGVKNLFGLVPGGTKARYHEALKGRVDYLDRFGSLLLDVYLATRPGLTVLDGVVGLARDGPAATGDPTRTRFLLASEDALALDLALCDLVGEDPGAVTTTRAALRRGIVPPVRLVGQPPRVHFPLLEDRPRPNPVARAATDLVFRNLVVEPWIDPDRCDRCGECVERCQVDAIRLDDQVVIDRDRCIACYGCPPVCAPGALHLRGSRLNRALQVVRSITGM